MSNLATVRPVVVIADDHPVFQEALRQLIAKADKDVAIVTVDSFDALRNEFAVRPDITLALLDLEIPGACGFSALSYLRATYPHTRVAIVSAHEDPDLQRSAVALGACTYITKSLRVGELSAGLKAALTGATWTPPNPLPPPQMHREPPPIARVLAALPPQQMRVLQGLSNGRLNKQIASELGVSESTVKGHVTLLLKRLGVKRRTQAALVAKQFEELQARAF